MDALAEDLRQGIRSVCADLEVPAQITGLGSLFGIHFTDHPLRNYRDIAAGDTRLRDQVFLGLMNEGILIAPNLVGALSTVMGQAEVTFFVAGFKCVLERHL